MSRQAIIATFHNDFPQVLHHVAFRGASGEAELASLDDSLVECVKVLQIFSISDDFTVLCPDKHLTCGLIRLKIHVLLSNESDELNNINANVILPSLNKQ